LKGIEAAQALLEEIAKVRDHGVTADELGKAQDLSKGRLLLRLEDSRAVSGWLGGQEMLNAHVRTPEEVVAAIERVTVDDIRRVAGRLLQPARMTMAVVGPYRSPKRFEALLT
jgi:predicted Zn-dependent peptidase